jgi:Ca-activated chloride channel family protein
MERMKLVVFLMCFAFISNLSSQNWKDSLRSARDFYQAGDFSNAYKKFNAAQRLAPSEIDLSHDIATSAYRKGEYQKAADAYEKLMPKTAEGNQWQKWHNIGNSQWKNGDLKSAAESYKQAIRLNPNAEESKYNLAQIIRQMRMNQEQQQQNQEQEKGDSDDSESGQNEQNQNSEEHNENDSPSDINDQKENKPDSNQKQESQEKQEGISDKRRDRMLEDLMEKEIATQRKMTARDQQGKEVPINSGKKW